MARLNIDELRQSIGMPLAIAAVATVLFMDTPAGLSNEGHRAIALFVGIFILYLSEAIPLAISSLLVVPVGVLIGAGSPKEMLSGFSSTSVYLILGAFILAVAMVKTLLAERITLTILDKIGCSATRITLGVMLSNIVLAFLVPSSTARTAILFPICISIIELLKFAGRSKFAVNILLTLAFTNATISAGILTATVPNPITIEFLAKSGAKVITYDEWLVVGFPPALLMTFITWYVLQLIYRPELIDKIQVQALINKKLTALGPMKSTEMRTLCVFLGVVTLWATQMWTKLDTTIICLAGACLLFFPKFGVIDWNDANKGVSWQVVMICGGGVSLGDILMKTGAAKWMALSIFQALGLGSLTATVLLMVVMFILLILHFIFVGTTAMATALLPIVVGLAQTAGIPPAALIVPAGMVIGGYPVVMFYSTLPNIIVYGSGQLRISDFLIPGSVICLLACLVYGLCATTYWPLLNYF